IARKLGYELVGHKLELYGHVIPGAEPVEREGLIYKRRPRDETED
ncbi:MAG: transcriptional repressor, partial [Brevundimonas diminuta]